jgi:aminoglycoside phosphotransferase (APT) family kinase protein
MSALPTPTGLDLEAVSAWLATEVAEIAPLATATLIQGGRSNLTYELVDVRGERVILRRPPPGRLQTSAQDVSREWAFIAALEPTPVPTAAPIAHCSDTSVIGAPFFVMQYVAGETLADPSAAGRFSAAARSTIADQMTTALAALHDQDPGSLGLDAFVRPGAYLERQLRRWSSQIAEHDSLASDLIEPVRDRLAERMPAPQRACIIHGDFKLANLRVSDDGTIQAVLDWELAAIGDPLADVGWLLASWAEANEPGAWIVPPPTSRGGFPKRAELAAAYGAKTGLDVSDLDYYIAFSYWRWSCINEGIRARFASGQMGGKSLDPAAVAAQIRWQLARAWELLA